MSAYARYMAKFIELDPDGVHCADDCKVRAGGYCLRRCFFEPMVETGTFEEWNYHKMQRTVFCLKQETTPIKKIEKTMFVIKRPCGTTGWIQWKTLSDTKQAAIAKILYKHQPMRWKWMRADGWECAEITIKEVCK